MKVRNQPKLRRVVTPFKLKRDNSYSNLWTMKYLRGKIARFRIKIISLSNIRPIIIYFHSSQCRLIPYLHQRPIFFKANSSIVAILELIRGAQCLIEVIRSSEEIISRHCDEWKYIIIGRIFESEIILIPPSLKIFESSSNGSYRNTDEVWWRYGISAEVLRERSGLTRGLPIVSITSRSSIGTL
jgi:hypothetical protein